MRLSIIIPVYNEEKTLLELLNRVNAVSLNNIEKEIIIVDDFSTDSTRQILKKLEKKYKIIYNEKNKGKGATVIRGLKQSTGDILLIQDADLEYDPQDYHILLKPILNNETKVVYGSRLLHPDFKANGHPTFILHAIGNKVLSILTSLIYFRKITDMETCYKVFTRDVIEGMTLRSKRFDFEPEITAKIIRRKFKIKEVPISFNPRSFNEGKKITWKDGLQHLFYLIKYRFID